MNDLKNKLTNIIGIIVAVGTVIATALESVPEGAEWYVWIGAVAVAVISYLTGKDKDGKKIRS